MMSSIINLLSNLDYFSIFLLMAIESSFIPFPSEAVLIPAGYLMALGKLSFFKILFFSILGSLVGAYFNYFLAFFLGRNVVELLIDKYGKFFFLKKRDLYRADRFFDKYGDVTTFFGRLIPVIRQLISLPAGFSKMNLYRFTFYTFLGAGVWSAFLIFLGYFFRNNATIILRHINIIIIFLLVIFFIYIFRKKLFKSFRVNIFKNF